MSECLPMGSFQWIDVAKFGLYEFSTDSLNGYKVDVGLEYSSKLYNVHND